MDIKNIILEHFRNIYISNSFVFASILILTLLILIYIFSLFYSPRIKKTKPCLHPIGYKLIYTDQKVKKRKDDVVYSKLLKSEKYNLQGKPDYIYATTNKLLPVELKSGKIGDKLEPHYGDLMQLGAYFIILNEEYGIRPKYGRLIYSDYMFIVKNTSKLNREVTDILNDMKSMLKSGEGEANADFVHCRHCICRYTVCEHCDKK